MVKRFFYTFASLSIAIILFSLFTFSPKANAFSPKDNDDTVVINGNKDIRKELYQIILNQREKAKDTGRKYQFAKVIYTAQDTSKNVIDSANVSFVFVRNQMPIPYIIQAFYSTK